MGASVGWTQIVTWIVVIVGWYFVNSSSNERESRKEVRKLIDDLRTSLDEFEDEIISYHKSANRQLEVERSINRSLNRFTPQLVRLAFFDIDTASLYGAKTKLKQASTLSNFASSSFNAQDDDSQILIDICAARDSLEVLLERAFKERFLRKSK